MPRHPRVWTVLCLVGTFPAMYRCALICFAVVGVLAPPASRADIPRARSYADSVRVLEDWRAAAPLVRLQALTSRLPHDEAVRLARSLAGARRLDPAVRGLVVDWLAELLWSGGDPVGSRAVLLADGVLTSGWWLLGPAAENDLSATDPLDLQEAVAARPEPAVWRDVSRAWPLGRLPVDRLLTPESDQAQAALALNHVWSRHKRSVILSARPGERIDIVVNGVPAKAGAAVLLPGWNRVIVRTRPPEAGRWSLTLRVRDLRGRPVLSRPPPPPSDVTAPDGTAAQHAGSPTLLERWSHPDAPAGGRARVLAAFGGDRQPIVAALLSEGAAADDALDGAKVARRTDLALRLLRRVLQADPGRLDARVALSARYHERGQSLTALDEVRTALAASPIHLEGRLLEAEILADLQALGAAQGRLLDLLIDYPVVPAVLEALASVYQRRQLPELALERYTELSEIDNGLGEVLFQQFELARGLGRADDAKRLAEALVSLRPDVAGHRLSLIRLLEDLGDDAAAVLALERAVVDFPRSADVAQQAGASHLRAGRKTQALALLRRSLFLRPHQPELRARIQRLQRSSGGFEQRWRLDPKTVIAEARPAVKAGPSTEYLLSQRVTRLFQDGTSSTWTQHVLRVNKVPSGDKERAWSVVYDPSRQSVAVLSASRYRAGRRIDYAEQTDVSVSEAWYGLYYEQRATTMRFTDLEPGDVLVVEHRLSDFGRSLYGRTFGDLVGLQDREPKHRMRVAWIAPAGLPLNVHLVGQGSDAVRPKTQESGGLRTVSLDLRGLEGIEFETRMPGYTEVALHAYATTFESWDAVAAWYRELISEQQKPSRAMVALAAELTAKAEGAEAKVYALHDFVTRRIRYVGLEFGEHGYKPYPASEVFERRFGDCKDKAGLLRVMLGLIGIESRLVLVRTRRQGRVIQDAVSPAVFDHAILYVPSIDRYLDATASYNGPEELPNEDQGASALIVGPSGGRFTTLPVTRAADNVLSREYEVRLSRSTVHLEAAVSATGAFAAPLREILASPASRREQLELMLAAEYPGFVLDRVRFDQVDDLTQSVELSFAGELAGGDAVRLLQPGLSLAGLAVAPRRKNALLMAHPFVWRWRFRLVSEDGRRPVLPKAGQVKSPFGSVTLRVTAVGDGGLIELEVRLETREVAVADYPEFRRFVRAADEMMQRASRVEIQ